PLVPTPQASKSCFEIASKEVAMNFKFNVVRSGCAAAALLAAVSGAAAQLPNVAIVSAASSTAASAEAYNLDVQAKLMSTGLFNSVAIIDVAVHAGFTPTLADLQQYDAI